jgi:hypothetical protein
METARRFITSTPIINGDLGCWSPSIPWAIVAAAVTAAFVACSLSFATTVFAQPASSLGELLVGKAAFGDWHADAPLVRRKISH